MLTVNKKMISMRIYDLREVKSYKSDDETDYVVVRLAQH